MGIIYCCLCHQVQQWTPLDSNEDSSGNVPRQEVPASATKPDIQLASSLRVKLSFRHVCFFYVSIILSQNILTIYFTDFFRGGLEIIFGGVKDTEVSLPPSSDGQQCKYFYH